MRYIIVSFQLLGSTTCRRQQTSYGDTSDIFVIIWDNKKTKYGNKTAKLRVIVLAASGLIKGKTMSRKIFPTFDNRDHVLSIRRRIRSKKKSTNLHYCFEDL